jgi:hypothetical protein
MARKVVCKICKSKGDTDTFYKVKDVDKGISKYYCNKEEYDNYIDQKTKRETLLKYIAEDVMDYEEGQIIPPVMLKKIGELYKFYTYDVIQLCFELCKDDIQYWITTKNFTNEYGMVSYIMKIIESNINDTFKKWKYTQKQDIKQVSNNLDLGILNELNVKPTVKKDDGILDFLDEDDI